MPARKRPTRKEVLAAHEARKVRQPQTDARFMAYRTGKASADGTPSLRDLLASKQLLAQTPWTREEVEAEIARRDANRTARAASKITVRFMTRDEMRAAKQRREAAAPPKRDKRKKATRHATDPAQNAEPCFGSKPRTFRILLWEDRVLGIPKIDPATGKQAYRVKSARPICAEGSVTVTRVPGPNGNGTYVPACSCCSPLVAALRTQNWDLVAAIERGEA